MVNKKEYTFATRLAPIRYGRRPEWLALVSRKSLVVACSMSQLERPYASGSRLGLYRALGVATRDGFLPADLNHPSL